MGVVLGERVNWWETIELIVVISSMIHRIFNHLIIIYPYLLVPDYLSLFTAEVAGSSSAIGHDGVTASAREDLCHPIASSWPKCHHLVRGKFVPTCCLHHITILSLPRPFLLSQRSFPHFPSQLITYPFPLTSPLSLTPNLSPLA